MTEVNQIELPMDVPSIILPINNGELLVPSVSVSELVNKGSFAFMDGPVPWWVGTVYWRGLELPLISFDLFAQFDAQFHKPEQVRIAIMNGMLGHQSLPFYALVVNGLPRLIRISDNILHLKQAVDLHFGEMYRLAVDDVELTLPDLELLEQHVYDQHNAV